MLSLTTGGPSEAYVEDGFNGDIDAILRPIQRGMLEFVGFQVLEPHIVYAPVHLNDNQRRMALTEYADRLENIDQELPIDAGRY